MLLASGCWIQSTYGLFYKCLYFFYLAIFFDHFTFSLNNFLITQCRYPIISLFIIIIFLIHISHYSSFIVMVYGITTIYSP
ncbi:hypothetical protein BDA99DRAFT_530729 [Phascolomyces articulosus]|uniref:Uncharacterized protein n=1 Tax=Phascolomyces articulosus TaxID=60185 RepID=A0AAD5P6P8_9FUNG|nr:hypothetical protein BDA99DRAFT_530729 [Phascolomyces articulosus]